MQGIRDVLNGPELAFESAHHKQWYGKVPFLECEWSGRNPDPLKTIKAVV